ncbi:hypothetical protein H0H93_006925 [Arthromyces matolae]|nr:hypothetical protein H0H93_006925 [Arthromyces matolae]
MLGCSPWKVFRLDLSPVQPLSYRLAKMRFRFLFVIPLLQLHTVLVHATPLPMLRALTACVGVTCGSGVCVILNSNGYLANVPMITPPQLSLPISKKLSSLQTAVNQCLHQEEGCKPVEYGRNREWSEMSSRIYRPTLPPEDGHKDVLLKVIRVLVPPASSVNYIIGVQQIVARKVIREAAFLRAVGELIEVGYAPGSQAPAVDKGKSGSEPLLYGAAYYILIKGGKFYQEAQELDPVLFAKPKPWVPTKVNELITKAKSGYSQELKMKWLNDKQPNLNGIIFRHEEVKSPKTWTAHFVDWSNADGEPWHVDNDEQFEGIKQRVKKEMIKIIDDKCGDKLPQPETTEHSKPLTLNRIARLSALSAHWHARGKDKVGSPR